MTIREAIDRADRMRPNVVLPEDKRRALWELESQFAEMIGEDIPDWEDGDDEVELIVAAPYDVVYVYNLCAYIDLYQEETGLYQLDAPIANQKQAEVKALYRRHHSEHDVPFRGVFI